MDRNVCFFVFLLFVIFTARDIVFKWNQSPEKAAHVNAAENVQKEIPSMSFRSTQTGPTIKVLYCYSCGYQQAFEEYRRMINERFPSINVVGNNYNPSFVKSKLVQVVSIAKMVVIGLLLANMNPFQHFGVNTPRVWNWMGEHKLYACLMTFFLSNTVESQLMASGAFEIFYNDVPIWSKLATGRIPSAQELFTMIDNQHKFYGSGEMFGSETMHTLSGHTL